MEAGGDGGSAGGACARAVGDVDGDDIEENNNSDDQGAGGTLAAAVPAQSPSKGRPMGAKRQKVLNDA